MTINQLWRQRERKYSVEREGRVRVLESKPLSPQTGFITQHTHPRVSCWRRPQQAQYITVSRLVHCTSALAHHHSSQKLWSVSTVKPTHHTEAERQREAVVPSAGRPNPRPPKQVNTVQEGKAGGGSGAGSGRREEEMGKSGRLLAASSGHHSWPPDPCH